MQHVLLVANTFLVIIQYHPHGLVVVSAFSQQLSGLVLAPFGLSFSSVDSVITPIVSLQQGAVKLLVFRPSNWSQMGYWYNPFWLAQFCITLGVLLMLAPFIDAEDRSPLGYICLIKVLLHASLLLQLAFGRGWNVLIPFLSLFSGLPLCFDCSHFYIFKQLATAELVHVPMLFYWVALYLFLVKLLWLYHLRRPLTPTHFDGVVSLLRFVFPALGYAVCTALFAWSAPLPSFSGSLQDFSQIVEEDDDMASEYGSDEGNPDSPIHPDNDFFSQIAQPGSTPAIISTA